MSEKRSGPPIGGPMGMGGKMGGGAKAKDFKKTMMDLIHYLEDYKGKITAVIILAAFSSLFSIVGPKILGKATTKLFEGLIAYLLGTNLLTDFPYIRNCIISLVVLYLISALFAYIQGYIMSGVSMNVTYKLRKEISHKMNKLPLKYFDTRTHGEVLSRITNDVDTVSQTLNQSLSQIITSTATVIGVLIMMLSISVLMLLF